MQIILASTSPYRKEILEKLCLPFITLSPEVDETPEENESPKQLVERLAILKAKAIADDRTSCLVIGSDQVAVIGNTILGKPGNQQAAVEQLEHASGKRVTFYTGLAVINSDTKKIYSEVVPYHVVFKDLSSELIERYIDTEQPFNCAGSFKSEGLGIILFERLEGDDPNTLIGLPLIRLIRILELEGVEMLA